MSEQNETTLECPICHQGGFKSRQGLGGHLRLAHRKDGPVAGINESSASVEEQIVLMKQSYDFLVKQVKDISQTLENLGKVEGSTMENVLTVKDMRVHELEGELKVAKEEAAAATKEAEEAKAAVEAAETEAAKAAAQMPSFDEFYAHCKVCDVHRLQLEAYNEKRLKDYVDGMSKDTVKAIAKYKGMTIGDFAPAKLSVRSGDTPEQKHDAKIAGEAMTALANTKVE